MACASRGERIESADAIRMCAGRVHERSDVPVEFAAGIPIIRLALAFLTRSGERKPPVGHIRRCESETHIARDMSRMQPRAGGRKRSVGCTPHARSKRRNSSRSTCRCGSESHGGLTPAALVNVRLCSANVVFRRETRYALRLPFSPASRHRATRSGGRKPPVVSLHAMATVIGPHTVGGFPSNRPRVCVKVSAEPRRAHARRSWSRSFPGKSRSFTVIAFRKPRRAEASRSCERAFVQRECRFSQRTNVVQPRAAGVSQPWKPNAGASALHYHGGLTPAALDGVRLPPKLALPSASRSACHGGLTPAVRGSAVVMRRTLFAVHSKRVSARIHGGLTPAALDGVRLLLGGTVLTE
jgi:hypothetical protein